MITIFISRLATVRTHPVNDDWINSVGKSLNAILDSSGALFVPGYLPARFCSNNEFIPAASEKIDFEFATAYKIGLVGCVEYFRESGTYHWTSFEISTEIVHVLCTRTEIFRKILWLWMAGLVERSLELRLTLPFGCRNSL